MTYLKVILKSIWEHITANLDVLLKILGAVWFFFAGVHMYLYAVLSLTVVDVVTGIVASIKRGEKFTSRKLRKGLLEKFALYMLLILTVFVLDLILKSVFHHDSFYFSFILTFLISTYECTSIMENVNTIRPNMPFMSALVRIFRKLGEKTVEKMEERVDDVVDKVTDFKTLADQKEEQPAQPSADSPEGQEGVEIKQ